MDNYTELSNSEDYLSGDEGYQCYLGGLTILKDPGTVLEELVEKYHGGEDFETYVEAYHYGNNTGDFNSSQDSWFESYAALLRGETVMVAACLDSTLLKELHQRGYISNCWVYFRDFYATKHQSHCIDCSPPTRLIDDGQQALTHEDVIEALIANGTIEELRGGCYQWKE